MLPPFATVLVVGGGPAGSYASAVLAQEGVDVVCCEAAHFPRYHIGESLLASVKAYLQMVDVVEKIDQHGFHPKVGSAIKFRPDRPEAYTGFIAVNPNNGAWNVDRSQFDHLLLNHAVEKGAKVFQGARISNVQFSNDNCHSAQWTRDDKTGVISFNYIIDCSGRQGILSTKLFRNRHFNQSLKNIATWTYWKGETGVYGRGTRREGAIFIEGLVNGLKGWVWYIPLADKVSVGVVMHESDNTALRRDSNDLKDHYMRALSHSPDVMEMLKGAAICDEIHMASDYSYSATKYAGPGWRLAGDAGAFIDPFFSSGVHLALNGGLSSAISVLASIRKDVSEEAAAAYHDKKVSMAYTRFLLVVLSAYKQLRHQDADVLSDVASGDFDTAFDIMRPVIQGLGDVEASHDRTLTEEALEKTMDFVASVLTTPFDEVASARESGYVPAHLFDRNGDLLGPEQIAKLVTDTGADEKTERALRSINARKTLKLYDPKSNFENEEVLGMVAHLQRGSFGLRTVDLKPVVASISGVWVGHIQNI
ncbi:Tryptophan 2-halogenase [Leucoagaricus sp. SymC.cos]|nr:Tryptophan 2-halogenase [Leucoagaricus sp. SymC.cos]